MTYDFSASRHAWLRWPLIACLYLSQGIPFGLAMEALPVILRKQGADLGALAWLPLVGLPWMLKFVWAAGVDNRWTPRLGRRRSWILPMQGTVLGCLLLVIALGISGPTLPWLVGLCALASVASATQDIATDGMVAERFPPSELPQANAIQTASTMIGFFYGGAFFLVLAERLGHSAALLALAAPVAASLILAAGWREPDPAQAPRRTVLAPASILRFLRRPGAVPLLAAALLSAAAIVSCHGLSKLLLSDSGWSMEDIGRLGMAGGAVTVLLGCGGGAWLVSRLGAARVFGLGVMSVGLAGMLWFVLSRQAAMPEAQIWLATALASFGAGSASVAVMTLAMAFAQASPQAGTDITTVQSMRDLGEIGASSAIIALAAHAGYGAGFLTGVGIALAVLLLGRVWRPGAISRQP